LIGGGSTAATSVINVMIAATVSLVRRQNEVDIPQKPREES
jgi:hypothetical protein